MAAARKISDDIAAALADEASLAVAEVTTDVAHAIEVFDNIPIPTGRAARETEYRWDINKGQSFFVYKPDVDQTKLLGRLTTAVANKNKRGTEKYIARKYTGPNGKLGVMVWRTV